MQTSESHELPRKALTSLKIGESAYIAGLSCQGSIRRRLLDVGFIKGARIICLGSSPQGNPKAYWIQGAVIALREAEAKFISIEEIRPHRH